MIKERYEEALSKKENDINPLFGKVRKLSRMVKYFKKKRN
jgi:hypothetical protein